jgi:hypothetical protein
MSGKMGAEAREDPGRELCGARHATCTSGPATAGPLITGKTGGLPVCCQDRHAQYASRLAIMGGCNSGKRTGTGRIVRSVAFPPHCMTFLQAMLLSAHARQPIRGRLNVMPKRQAVAHWPERHQANAECQSRRLRPAARGFPAVQDSHAPCASSQPTTAIGAPSGVMKVSGPRKVI